MKGSHMYKCPSCYEGFSSKYLGIKNCPFCGAKYKESYSMHINLRKDGKPDWGRLPQTLVMKIYERYNTTEYDVELRMNTIDQLILYLTPIREPVVTNMPVQENPVGIVTRPDISINLSNAKNRILKQAGIDK